MDRQKTRIATTAVFAAVLLLAALVPIMPAQTSQGKSRYNAWEFPEAEKLLQQAVKKNPQDHEAAYYLGLSLLMQDKHQESLDVLLKVQSSIAQRSGQNRSAVPDAYQLHIAIAHAYLELKQNEEALKQVEAADALRNGAVEVLVYRGAYYLNLEKLPQAIQELEKAMKLDENNPYAHYYAGYAYLRSGNPSKAVEMFRSFLELAPGAPEYTKVKALVDALC